MNPLALPKTRLRFSAALFSLLAFALLFCAFCLTQLHRLWPKDGAPGWWESAGYCLMVASGLAVGIGSVTAPFLLSSRPWLRRLGHAGASLFGAALLASAYVDTRLFEVLGVHLYDSSVTALLGRGAVNESLHITAWEVALVAGGTWTSCPPFSTTRAFRRPSPPATIAVACHSCGRKIPRDWCWFLPSIFPKGIANWPSSLEARSFSYGRSLPDRGLFASSLPPMPRIFPQNDPRPKVAMRWGFSTKPTGGFFCERAELPECGCFAGREDSL